jgi:hypothetical protein
MAKQSERTCFVISPIGPDGSDIRKWADQTFKHLIEPVVEECGFSPTRADKEARAGIITTHIIQRLVTSDLVIADLTTRNPNVFYELAVRHVTRKPLVQIIREDEDIPFDVQGMRTVKFQLADPDILEAARGELKRHVDAVKDEEELDTPISQAVELQIAMESGDPNQVSLAEIASSLQDLTAEVRARPKPVEELPMRVTSFKGPLPEIDPTEWVVTTAGTVRRPQKGSVKGPKKEKGNKKKGGSES